MNIDIVNKINESPYKAFIAITGGGATFISDYLKISGASKTIVGCIIPYDRTVFNNFVGIEMKEFSSPLAARKLALASYQRCREAGVENRYAIGISAASSIAFDGERVGRQHKINIAIHKFDSTKVITVTVEYGKKTREEEDAYIAELIFNQLTIATGLNDNVPYDNYTFNSDFSIGQVRTAYNPDIQRLVNGDIDHYSTTRFDILTKLPKIALFGGSFSPLHTGHIEIQKRAENILNRPVWFELSIKNADKGFIDYIDINDRIKDLYCNYIIDAAPRIKDKVELIKKYNPKCEITFVMGVDTYERVFDVKYGIPLDELYKFFKDNNVKFLVFGRHGRAIDTTYGDLLIESNEAANFNMNISSTEIKNKLV